MQALELRTAEPGAGGCACIGEKGGRQGSCTGGGREIGQRVACEEADKGSPDSVTCGLALADRCQPDISGALVEGGWDSDLLFPDPFEI